MYGRYLALITGSCERLWHGLVLRQSDNRSVSVRLEGARGGVPISVMGVSVLREQPRSRLRVRPEANVSPDSRACLPTIP